MKKLVLIEKLKNLPPRQILIGGKETVFAASNAHYALIDLSTGKPPVGMKVLRHGGSLVVHVADEEVARIDGFFEQTQGATFSVDGTLNVTDPTPASSIASSAFNSEALAEQPVIIWNGSDTAGDLHSFSPMNIAAIGGALGLAAAGGGAGGAGAGGGGGGSVGFIISGSIVAGPVLNTNGLTITAYKADGTVLASGAVNSDGTYSITVAENYTGTILVRVVDTNSSDDYLDEATGQGKDLSTDLRVVTTVTGPGNITLNINPLTELAVRELGLAGGDAGTSVTSLGSIGASQIETANSNIATAMGLAGVDLVNDPVLPVINSDGTPNTGANDYGVVLAILSGMENAQGEETGIVIDYLAGELNGISLTPVAEAELVAGASNAGESLPDGIVDPTQEAAVADAQATIKEYAGSGGAPTETDYSNAGVSGVTGSNVDAINSAIALLGDTATDSVAELQGIASAYTVVLAAAAGGPAPTLVHLQALGLTGVTADNLAAVQAAIAATANDGSEVDTLSELQSVVTTATVAATSAAQSAISSYDGTGAAPALSDYANAGVTGVTSSNLAAINSALAGLDNTATDTPAEVQSVVDAYSAVLSGANAGTAPTLVQLETLGLTGVTADNLAAVQSAIAATANDGSGVDTLAELQSVVTAGVTAATMASQSAISGYTGSNTAPTLSDYANTGVTGVTSGNIAAINSALAGLDSTATDTPTEVQAVVNAYTTLLSVADGNDNNPTSPSQSDYTTLGVTGVDSAAKVSLLGEVLDTKAAADIDTVAKIQGLADIVSKVMLHAAGTTQTITQAEFETLGLTNLTSARVTVLLNHLAATANDGTGADTLTELQALVDVTPPTANLTTVTDDYGSVTGNLSSGDYTNDTTLLLSGTCESGSTVNVYNGANLLGAATVSGTNWTYTATVANATTYLFNVKETDAAGNTSAATSNFTVIGDTSAPTASVQTATMDGTGTAVVQSTEIGTAYLVNSTVTVTNLASITGAAGNLFNNVNITTAGTNTNLSASGLIDGSYKVYTVDAVGNLSAPSSNTVTIQDMTAPTISSVSVPSAATYIVGQTMSFTVNTDEVVSVTGTPRLALTVGASTVYANYVSGSGTSALVFSYTVQSGAADSDGIAVASLDLNGGTIRDGASNNLVTTLNSVGATSTVRVDGIAPTANISAATDNVGSVTGSLVSGARTDDNELVLSGTCEANSTVNVYDGTNLLGAATVTGTNWSYSATVSDATVYQFNVIETDVNGNASARSGNFTVIGDTAAPSVDDYSFTGTTGITTINGANYASASFTLTGTREEGASVEVWKDGSLIGTVPSASSASWTYNVTGLSEGNYSFQVKMTDAAGNTSALSSASYAVSVDTTPPAVPSIDLVENSNQQPLSTGARIGPADQWSPFNTVWLSGTCEADALIKIYNDLTFVDEVQATGTTWQKQVMVDTEGAYNFNVKAFDAFGNGSAASSSFVINFDATAPTFDADNSPIVNAIGFDPAGNIVLTFSEDIRIDPAGGNVSLWSSSGSALINLLDSTQVSVSGDTLTINPSSNLEPNAHYDLSFLSFNGASPIQDLAGNAVSTPILFSFDTGTTVLPEARVFFDLTTGTDFTDQAVQFGREFQAGYSYTIYVKVDSDSSSLTALTGGAWTGGNNLGNDDKIVLVGNDGTGVRNGAGGYVNRFFSATTNFAWKTGSFPNAFAAKITNSGDLVRRTNNGVTTFNANGDLWTGRWAGYINASLPLTAVYHPQMSNGVLNPAGTAFA